MPLSVVDAELLEDMRSAAVAARSFVEGLTLSSYVASDLHASAVERKLIVIGEAAASVSHEVQRRYASIQWDRIMGLRHKLVHEYFDVDSDLSMLTRISSGEW
jgi:uncharacterized protein with HEPN domain